MATMVINSPIYLCVIIRNIKFACNLYIGTFQTFIVLKHQILTEDSDVGEAHTPGAGVSLQSSNPKSSLTATRSARFPVKGPESK